MTEDEDVEPATRESPEEETSWDALEVLRARAATSRLERDESIKSLRESMTDAEIREEYGLDLHGIEG